MKGMHLVVAGALALSAAVPLAGGARPSEAYILCLGQASHAFNLDLDELLRIRKGRTGDFLWFRRGGRTWIVTDSGALAVGHDIMRPIRELGREQKVARERARPFEAREEELDREQDRLDERLDHIEDGCDRVASEERARLKGPQRELESLRRALQAEVREIEASEQRLEAREQETERVADEKVQRLIDDVLRRGLARRLR